MLTPHCWRLHHTLRDCKNMRKCSAERCMSRGGIRSRLMFNEQRLCSLTQHKRREKKKVRNAYTPTCHVALERQCCLISSGYVRALCNRPVRYICRMSTPEGYTLIRILLDDTAFPQPLIIIQLSTYFLLVLKLKVCRCKGKILFSDLVHGCTEATERSPVG